MKIFIKSAIPLRYVVFRGKIAEAQLHSTLKFERAKCTLVKFGSRALADCLSYQTITLKALCFSWTDFRN